MDVAEAIGTLSELRDEKEIDLTTNQCHAIGIALVIMLSLIPEQVTMIDSLIAMTHSPSN